MAASLALRRELNDAARGVPIRPHIHVAVGDVVLAEDRADVRPVIVAMVQRLHDDYCQVQVVLPVRPIDLDHLGLAFSCRLDELIRALARELTQPGDTRKLVLFVGGRLAACETFRVPLLGSDKMVKRRSDGAVCARRRQPELLLGQLRANVKQVKVRPPVIPERLDPWSVQRRLILKLGKLSRHKP